MYNRIKKFMPTGIMAVGFAIFSILYFTGIAYSQSSFRYETFILSEHLCETAYYVFAECLIGAIVFKLCLKKEKSGDHDFEQKS